MGEKIEEFIENSLHAYGSMVYRLAWTHTRSRVDAEDVFQEVFLRYMQHAHKLKDEEHQKAWLIRTTINCSRNIFRNAWFKMQHVPLDAIEEQKCTMNADELGILESVRALPHKYRTVIYLFNFEDCSIQDIGRLLTLKESTVKSQLVRARQRLKELLKGDFDDG